MSDNLIHVSGVHLSGLAQNETKTNSAAHTKPKHLTTSLIPSSSKILKTKFRGTELMERAVENAAVKASGNDGKIVALDLFVRIPNSRRREIRESYFCVCQPAWTTLLLCMVITLVLINDISIYTDINYRERREAYMQDATLSTSNEVTVYPFLHVEVYYEALCPDSRYFIMKQLTPAYENLHEIMKVALIPYGKARTIEKDGKLSFECQHGPLECKANMVHACVTNVVKDEGKQLAIIHCMIDKNDVPMKVGQKCVEKHGENWDDVKSCVVSEKGSSIMKHMGDMTNSLEPRVSFIPTITVDRSQHDQKHILQDLHKVLCKRYKGPKLPSC
ncbi:gamma-interferon-inducible lysosomal thiol reductase isoform X1 [Cherax quadricarinatus]